MIFFLYCFLNNIELLREGMSALPGSFGKNSIYLCISLYVLESMHANWRWAQIECLLLIFPIFASRFLGYSSDFTSISLHSFPTDFIFMMFIISIL